MESCFNTVSSLRESLRTWQSISGFSDLFSYLSTFILFENCTIFSLSKITNKLEEIATYNKKADMISHISFKYGNGLSAWNASKKRCLHLNNIQYEYYTDEPKIHSFLSLPIMNKNKVIGVINFSHTNPNAFESEGVDRLRELFQCRM